jgi:hypothetical protein
MPRKDLQNESARQKESARRIVMVRLRQYVAFLAERFGTTAELWKRVEAKLGTAPQEKLQEPQEKPQAKPAGEGRRE